MNLSKSPMTIAGAACGAVSVVLGIVAIALPKWVVFDAGIAQIGYGLWSACASVSLQGHVVFKSYDHTPGWLIATATIEVAGICVIVFAVSLAFLHIFIAKNNKVPGMLGGPSAIIGGVLMIVGAIVWAVKYKDQPELALYSLSVGFILAIVSAILSFIAGSLLFLGWRAEFSQIRWFENAWKLNRVNIHLLLVHILTACLSLEGNFSETCSTRFKIFYK